MPPNQEAVDAMMSFVTALRESRRQLLRDSGCGSIFELLNEIQCGRMPRCGFSGVSYDTYPNVGRPMELVMVSSRGYLTINLVRDDVTGRMFEAFNAGATDELTAACRWLTQQGHLRHVRAGCWFALSDGSQDIPPDRVVVDAVMSFVAALRDHRRQLLDSSGLESILDLLDEVQRRRMPRKGRFTSDIRYRTSPHAWPTLMMASSPDTLLTIGAVRDDTTGEYVEAFDVGAITRFLTQPNYKLRRKDRKIAPSWHALTAACQWLAKQGHLRHVRGGHWFTLRDDADIVDGRVEGA
jgi:hypothetical protein